MPKIKVKGQTVQTGERYRQTDGHTHAHTDAKKRCYAFDNNANAVELILLARWQHPITAEDKHIA